MSNLVKKGKITIIKNKPGTYFGKKVELDGYKFDSEKEARFYEQYLKGTKLNYTIHESFTILPKQEISRDLRLRSAIYTPDFIIRNDKGELEHVIDLKNSFTQFAIDAAAQLRFKLFYKMYGIPVEIVVPRAKSFRMKIMGTTKKFEPITLDSLNYKLEDIITEGIKGE